PIRSGPSETFPRRVTEVVASDVLADQVRPLLEVIDDLTVRIAELDRRLKAIADASPIASRLASVPYVGPITALGFVAALDDADRFDTAHQVESYLGLVPRERSSGEIQRRDGSPKPVAVVPDGCS